MLPDTSAERYRAKQVQRQVGSNGNYWLGSICKCVYECVHTHKCDCEMKISIIMHIEKSGE